MKYTNITTKPKKLSNLNFNDLYEEISQDWEYKARKLQARRWRMLKHPVKTGY